MWQYLIIIIIIKICSAHIHVHVSTLLGAQGAETEKTWIQTIYSDSKNKIMYRDTCTMQLQIRVYINFEKLWHKMSFKQRLKSGYTCVLWQDSSLVGRWFHCLGAATEKDLHVCHPRSVLKLVPLGVTCCWSANCMKECRPFKSRFVNNEQWPMNNAQVHI